MATISEQQLGLVKKLYYKKKLGVPEIARTLKTSVDATYYFMRLHKLERRSNREQNLARFELKVPSFVLKQKLSIKEEILRIAGVMLYWGEGYQSLEASGVDFANSKPEMILVFLKFLRTVCGIQEKRLKAYLYCYSNQNPRQLISFWSGITKIPVQQFTKPYVRSDFDKTKIDKMRYGLLHVRYYDKKLLYVIRDWINRYIKDLGILYGQLGE